MVLSLRCSMRMFLYLYVQVRLIGGLVLPVWDTVERALRHQTRAVDRRLHVVRIMLTGEVPVVGDLAFACPGIVVCGMHLAVMQSA